MADRIGLILSSYGRGFIVEYDQQNYQGVARGKKNTYVVGDLVTVELINKEQLQIINLHYRENLIYRKDSNRQKIIASNVSQLLIVIAVKPNFNSYFLNSCLIFSESAKIKPVIIINKSDLNESTGFISHIAALYKDQLRYEVVALSALNSCNILLPLMANKQNLLIGQSGVGKSTITNQIVPDANTRVNRLTRSTSSGKHTTTNATLYHLNTTTTLIDSPGLQEFGLLQLDISLLANFFPELTHYIGQCKFRNCLHLNEPECAITKAHDLGLFDKVRFSFLQTITSNLLSKNKIF